jgi:hypothetical protein
MDLCKLCIHYNPIKKTCVKYIPTVKPPKNNLAETVRLDEKQCGPQAKWFKSNPVEDEFFDM